MRRLAVVFVLGLTSALAAQTTWIVDGNSGPGSQFTKIQDAIDAAAAGDVILVREVPYAYSEGLTVNKGVAILGQPRFRMEGQVFRGVTAAVEVRDIPPGQTFVLANAEVKIEIGDGVRIVDAQGAVHLQEVDVRARRLGYEGVEVHSSPDVTLTDCVVGAVGSPSFDRGFRRAVEVTDSNVTLVGSTIFGVDHGQATIRRVTVTVNAGTGVWASNSSLHLARTDVHGGSGTAADPGRSAIDLQGSTATVAGLPGNPVHAGAGSFPLPGIRADTGSAVVVDTDVDVRGSGGFAAWGGGGQFTQRVVAAVDADPGALGGVIVTQTSAQASDIVLLYLGLPVAPVSTPYGRLHLDAGSLFRVAADVLPPSGITSRFLLVPNDVELRGLTVGFQAAHWNHVSGAVELTNLTRVTLR